MGCAKHANNPLIHKLPHCYAIIWAVEGGSGKMSSLSASVSHLSPSFLFLDIFTYSLTLLNYSLHPSLSFAGATVLLVNATDLDASREFGQASLIYSLEGSSQFRLNSRSGVVAWACACVSACVCTCVHTHACSKYFSGTIMFSVHPCLKGTLCRI